MNIIRKYMPSRPEDPFKVAKRNVATLKKAERVKNRRDKRKAIWDIPGERVEYNREQRKTIRNRRLDRLVPTRHCPLCKELKLESRRWVIVDVLDLAGLTTSEAETMRECSVSFVVKKNRGIRRKRLKVRYACCCRSCVMLHFKDQIWPGTKTKKVQANIMMRKSMADLSEVAEKHHRDVEREERRNS